MTLPDDARYAVLGLRVGFLRSLLRTPPAASYSGLSLPYSVATPVNMRLNRVREVLYSMREVTHFVCDLDLGKKFY